MGYILAKGGSCKRVYIRNRARGGLGSLTPTGSRHNGEGNGMDRGLPTLLIDGKERRAAAGMYKDYMFTRSKKALREQVQKTGESLAGVYRVSFASGDEEV